MTGETAPTHHFCPPLGAPVEVPSPAPDVFDHPSVSRDEARWARAGLSGIPDLVVEAFWFGAGRFHARVRFMGHVQTLTRDSISALSDGALRVRAAFLPAPGQEAA